jgi:hypothetical protein
VIDRYLSHIVAYSFALHFFLGLVTVLNASNLTYFYYFPATVHIIVAGRTADLYLWLSAVTVFSAILLAEGKRESRRIAVRLTASGAIVLAALLFLAPTFRVPTTLLIYLLFAAGSLEFLLLVRDRKLTLFNHTIRSTVAKALIYLLALFSALEISSAAYYALRPFNLASSAAAGQLDAVIDLQLSYAAYGLLPWLYIGFLTSWFWVPVVNRFWKKARILTQPTAEPPPNRTSRELLSVILDPKFVLAIAVAVFIGYYPYFQNTPWLVGTDSYWRYYDPLLRMNAKGGAAALRQALGERHPVPVMLLYGVQQLTQLDPFQVVKLSPVFLTLFLAFAFLCFLGRKNSSSLGLLAFLFSILSATTALGLYSSIIANWMVLVAWIAFLAYLGFRTDEHFRLRDFLALFMLSTLMIIIHPWTWGVFAVVILAASIFALVQEKRKSLRVGGSMILIIVVDVAFGLLSITYLAGSEGWRVVDALDLYTYVFQNPSTIFEFWPALNWTTKFWSAFFSPIYIFLAILGVFALVRTDISTWRRRLILSWIFVSMIGSILVAPVGFVPNSPASSDSQLWRMLFLTPFQVTAPLAVMWLSRRSSLDRSNAETAGSGNDCAWVPAAWVLMVMLLGILMAFAPTILGLSSLLLVIPIITSVCIEKAAGREGVFLSYAIQTACILFAFNFTARAIAQLLIDPHNYLPPNAQFGSG